MNTPETILAQLREALATNENAQPPIIDMEQGEVYILVVYKRYVSADGPELVGLVDSAMELTQLIRLHRLAEAIKMMEGFIAGRKYSAIHDEMSEARGALMGLFETVGPPMADTGLFSTYATYLDSGYHCYIVAKPGQSLRLQAAMWASPQLIE